MAGFQAPFTGWFWAPADTLESVIVISIMGVLAQASGPTGIATSVNSAMIKSAKGKALIQEIPHNRLLTKTDGPFIEVDGRHAVPTDVRKTIDGIGKLGNIDTDEATTTVISNFLAIIASRRAHDKLAEGHIRRTTDLIFSCRQGSRPRWRISR
jgi:hypothetical protein